jgi:hypothetical protein
LKNKRKKIGLHVVELRMKARKKEKLLRKQLTSSQEKM